MNMKALFLQLINAIEPHSKSIFTLGISLLLLVGIAYSLMLGDALRFSDERDYLRLATNLANAGEYALTEGQPTAYRPPGYPILLAALLSIGIPIQGMRIANFLMLVTATVLLSRMAQDQTQRPAAAVLPYVVIAYPLFVYTAGALYPQMLAALLLTTFLFTISRPIGTATKNIVAGLVFGLLLLTLPLYLLLLPAFLLWVIVRRPIRIRDGLLICLIAGVTTLPWLARNYVTFDVFPLFGTNSGNVLLLGNSENTTPNSGIQADISSYRDQARDLDEVERNRFFTERAIDNILNRPGRSATLYMGKFLNWFNVNPNLATTDEQHWLQIFVLAASYAMLIGLLLLRLWYTRKWPLSDTEALSLLLYLAAAAAYAIFFTRIRFRVPFDLLLVLPVSSAIRLAVAEIAAKRSTPP